MMCAPRTSDRQVRVLQCFRMRPCQSLYVKCSIFVPSPSEVLVDLREAILQIGRHFHLTDPRLASIPLTPDYSMESHAQDHEVYAGVMRSKKRRAKALLDFERHDDDELGFRKNDVITIISQKVRTELLDAALLLDRITSYIYSLG